MLKKKWERLGELERQEIVSLAHQTLNNHAEDTEDVKQAYKYLLGRGLNDATIRAFQIGYVPIRSEYHLSGRLIFPICDPYGELAYVSTRDIRTNTPKEFVHWHEDFEKSLYFYGLDVAKPNIVKHQKALVVEGQFDVTCLHAHGVNVTVGTCGSTISLAQIALLSRYCSKIFLCFDADKNGSGQRGIERCMKIANEYNLVQFNVDIIPVMMPISVDPDDYVLRYGKPAFANFLREAEKRYFEKKEKKWLAGVR
jgi:DNA primase